jgi:hypothetical protein
MAATQIQKHGKKMFLAIVHIEYQNITLLNADLKM